MGLFYKTMIKEIKNDFISSKESDLISFLKKNENRYKMEYKLDESLFYMNICEILRQENLVSNYFIKKLNDQEN